MPGTIRLGALLALLAVAVALSGCGSDEVSGEIPQDQAAELNSTLAAVSDDIAAQNCEDAASGAEQFVAQVNDLPMEAGTELKAELREAGEHLGLLVSEECVSTEPSGTTQNTSSTPPTSTPTESSTTESSTTETSTTTTTSTEDAPPPGNGNGPPGGGPPGNGGTGGTGGPGDGDDK